MRARDTRRWRSDVGDPSSRTERETDRAVATDGGTTYDGEGPAQSPARSVLVTEALKESAMDAAPIGITITDPSLNDNPLVYVNDAYERITGYSREEVIGRNCRLLQGEGTREEPVARMREAVENAESVSVTLRNYRKDGEMFWNRVDVAPLFDDDGDVEYFVGFQTDVTRRKLVERAARERARAYRDERQALESVLSRVDGLLADVTTALVQATTRQELQERVCERVAETSTYDLAWVGEYDRSAGGVAPVVGFANENGGSRELGSFDVDFAADDPVIRTAETASLHLVPDASKQSGGRLHGPGWPDRYDSMAAVPLAYGDVTYGVLAVYAREAGRFDEHERVVLASLGRTVATAINAVENQRRVASDDVAQVRMDVAATDLFPVALANLAECSVALAGAEGEGDRLLLLFDVTGADAEAVAEVAADFESVSLDVVVADDDGCLVEYDGPATELVAMLAERGVSVDALVAEPGEARLGLAVPAPCDGREVIASVQTQYPDAALVAYHNRDQETRTRRELLATVEDELTERQRAVLTRAYAAGFFESPRAVSGEAIAESMGLSPSTFHEHLRAALGKVVGEITDSGDRSSTPS
jgi:PAS domain S-box-containing protein